MAEAVVELAALRVGQDLVGLDDFAETVIGIRFLGHVGMELTGEAPERPLDLVRVRRSRHAEKLVVVALSRGHRLGKRSGGLSCLRRPARRNAGAPARRLA